VVHQINLIKSTIVQYYVPHNAKGETKVFPFFRGGAALVAVMSRSLRDI
jgi:hypothetical protein